MRILAVALSLLLSGCAMPASPQPDHPPNPQRPHLTQGDVSVMRAAVRAELISARCWAPEVRK